MALAEAPPWYGDDVQQELPTNPVVGDSEDANETSPGPPSESGFDEYQPFEGDESGFEDDSVGEVYDDPYPAEGGEDSPSEEVLPHDDGQDVEWIDDSTKASRRGIEGPRPPEDPDPDPPGWLEDFFDWLQSLEGPDVDIDGILLWVKYLAVGLLGLLLLAFLIRLIRRTDLPLSGDDEETSALDALRELTGAQHHSTLADVQQWDIAIHALLLDVFERLEPSHDFVSAPAVTCREIAGRIEPLGGPWTNLVAISESSVFALIPASEEDYLRALSLHSTLVGGR